MGKTPDHRRDRRRPARRGHRHGLRPLRPAVRRLHGRGGRRAAGAQRRAHAAAGRRGAAGDQRLGDAQGRHERGAARLGRQRRGHLLPDRLRGRAAPLSGDGARLPGGDRPRDPRAGPGRRRPPAGRPDRLRRRRLQRHRPLPPLPRRRRAALSASRRRARACTAIATPRRSMADGPACCTATGPICCRTRDGRSSRPTPSPPVSTIPASVPSTPGCTRAAACDYLTANDEEALDAFRLCSRLEGIVPALESAHALAAARRSRPGDRQGRISWWSTSPAAATRISPPSLARGGLQA